MDLDGKNAFSIEQICFWAPSTIPEEDGRLVRTCRPAVVEDPNREQGNRSPRPARQQPEYTNAVKALERKTPGAKKDAIDAT